MRFAFVSGIYVGHRADEQAAAAAQKRIANLQGEIPTIMEFHRQEDLLECATSRRRRD